MASSKIKKETKEETTPSRKKAAMELGLSLALALAMALVIKLFIFDFYSIPTGSMEPRLFGKQYAGDRVFCFKKAYMFRDRPGPDRWEVFVFDFPAMSTNEEYYNQNFIKRCVGLPGDTVYLADGDLYIENKTQPLAKVARKGWETQQDIWIPIYRDEFSHENMTALDYHWDRTGTGGRWRVDSSGKWQQLSPNEIIVRGESEDKSQAFGWSLENGELTGRAGETIYLRFRSMHDGTRYQGIVDRHVKRQVVTFSCPQEDCDGKLRKTVNSSQLTGFCPSCGAFLNEEDILDDTFLLTGIPGDFRASPKRQHPFNTCRDISFSCKLRPLTDKNGEFQASLYTDKEIFTLQISFGSPAKALLLYNGQPVADTRQDINLSPRLGTDITLARYDEQIVYQVGGGKMVVHQLPGLRPDWRNTTNASGVQICLARGEAAIDNLALHRDLYYFFVPPGKGTDRNGNPYDPRTYFYHFTKSTALREILRGKGHINYDDFDATAARDWQKLAMQVDRMEREHCYIVPENGYLAFGDNSPTSNDSRAWGPVPQNNLVGPALLVWWPPHRIGIIE